MTWTHTRDCLGTGSETLPYIYQRYCIPLPRQHNNTQSIRQKINTNLAVTTESAKDTRMKYLTKVCILTSYFPFCGSQSKKSSNLTSNGCISSQGCYWDWWSILGCRLDWWSRCFSPQIIDLYWSVRSSQDCIPTHVVDIRLILEYEKII
jgi:hypothetical protein